MAFYQRLSFILMSDPKSQGELAQIAGVSQPMISQYRSGDKEPKDDVIRRISTAFNVDYEWLKSGDEKNAPNGWEHYKDRFNDYRKMYFDLLAKITEKDKLLKTMQALLKTKGIDVDI